jgi:hypothetical protein
VSIFAKATGNPKIIAAFYRTHSLGYDDKGNLFVDGRNGGSSGGPFMFGELVKGKVKAIALKGGTINLPGGVQWDGSYITVGDRSPGTIYRISAGKIVGSISLTGEANTVEYVIDGKTVVDLMREVPTLASSSTRPAALQRRKSLALVYRLAWRSVPNRYHRGWRGHQYLAFLYFAP